MNNCMGNGSKGDFSTLCHTARFRRYIKRYRGAASICLGAWLLAGASGCRQEQPVPVAEPNPQTQPASSEPIAAAPPAKLPPAPAPAPTPEARDPEPAAAEVTIPDPVEEGMQPQIVELLEERRAVVAERPDSADVWLSLGIACDAHKLYDCAEVCYRRSLSLVPNAFTVTYYLAYILDAAGKGKDESIELYRAAAKIEPKYPTLYYRLGKALERRDNLPEALDAYLDALNVNYDFAPAHRAAGQVRLALGDGDAALQNLRYAVQLDRSNYANMSALLAASKALGMETRFASTRREEEPQIRVDIPDPVRKIVRDTAIDSPTLLRRAKAKIHAGKHAEAIPDLKIVERAIPDDSYVHLYLGTCYHRTGDLGLAAAHLKNSVRLKEDSAGAQLEYARILIEFGRLEEGLHHYDQAVAYSPEPRDIHIWIAATLFAKGHLKYAAEAYESAFKIASLDARSFSRWGNALFRQGDYEGAADKFKKATYVNPGDVDAYYNQGISLERSGKITEAITLYEKVISLEPDHPRAGMRLDSLASSKP